MNLFNKKSQLSVVSCQLSPSRRKGFTLIEILITISIIAVLATVMSSYYGSVVKSIDLDATAKNIIFDLKTTQARAMSGEDSSGDGIADKWGVCFRNPSGSDLYEIVSPPGTCAAESISSNLKSTIYLPGGINFSSPTSGAYQLVIFDRINGIATATPVANPPPNITITISAITGGLKTITITPEGRIY